ncbi:MAG: hypothetical protein EOM16_10090, partial [Bacteroidia bacterium]|nr:hypothetical protein [Bacteroidia bacterium]
MKNIEMKYVAIAALIPFVLLAPFSYVVIKNWDMGIGYPEWILAHAFVPCLFGVTGAIVYGVIRLLQKLIYPVGKPWISLVFYI